MLNLNNVPYLVETKYAGRRSGEPLLSVTKTGVALNAAFCRDVLNLSGLKKDKTYYVQLTESNDRMYLLLADDKFTNFYMANYTVQGKHITITAKGFRDLLGKKNKTVRYILQPEKTNNPSIKAFELIPYVEDKVKSQDLDSDFKIG